LTTILLIMTTDELLEPPLVLGDFIRAVASTRPTVSADDVQRQKRFAAEGGSD
jgi:vacuolar protein-sorting-associated protein 4